MSNEEKAILKYPVKMHLIAVIMNQEHSVDVNQELRQAYLAGLNDRDEWQPIETVPKDRTMVDLWFVDGKRGKRLVDCEYLHDKWWYGTVNLEHYGKPTHWMLSPTSPKK